MRRWSDDITDWCGCSLPEAVQLASDREVERSRWPQRPTGATSSEDHILTEKYQKLTLTVIYDLGLGV